jgi:hypothetical protein
VEGQAGDGADALGHEGGVIPDDAKLFSLEREHLHQLLCRAAHYNRGMSVHCQSCQRPSVCVYSQVCLTGHSYVQELYVSSLGSAHYLIVAAFSLELQLRPLRGLYFESSLTVMQESRVNYEILGH